MDCHSSPACLLIGNSTDTAAEGAEDPASLRKDIVASDGVHVTTLGNNFNFQKLRGSNFLKVNENQHGALREILIKSLTTYN